MYLILISLTQEILVYILPLINYHKVKRVAQRANPFVTPLSFARVQSAANISVQTKCIYCEETPVLPHHMGCMHIFCYMCLKVSFILSNSRKFTVTLG